MGYQYKGTIRDLDEPELKPQRATKLTTFDPSACGTYAGYRRHQTHGVMPACEACTEAMAAYSRLRYKPAPKPVFRPDACGTWAGWQRHMKYGIKPCEACLVASRAYQREWRASRKRAK